jgi:hypothetical protein
MERYSEQDKAEKQITQDLVKKERETGSVTGKETSEIYRVSPQNWKEGKRSTKHLMSRRGLVSGQLHF